MFENFSTNSTMRPSSLNGYASNRIFWVANIKYAECIVGFHGNTVATRCDTAPSHRTQSV